MQDRDKNTEYAVSVLRGMIDRVERGDASVVEFCVDRETDFDPFGLYLTGQVSYSVTVYDKSQCTATVK